MHPFVKNGYHCINPLVLHSKNITYVSMLMISLYIWHESVLMMSWMDLEFHSYFHVEFLYTFCGILLSELFCFIYILVAFSHVWMVINILINGLDCTFPDISNLENFVVWNFNTSMYLNLGSMSDFSVVQKYLLSLW